MGRGGYRAIGASVLRVNVNLRNLRRLLYRQTPFFSLPILTSVKVGRVTVEPLLQGMRRWIAPVIDKEGHGLPQMVFFIQKCEFWGGGLSQEVDMLVAAQPFTLLKGGFGWQPRRRSPRRPPRRLRRRRNKFFATA